MHLRSNARDLCESQLRHHHQTLGDLETRLRQRREELEEIRTKSHRFQLTTVHFQADLDRLLQLIDKTPDVRLARSLSLSRRCSHACVRRRPIICWEKWIRPRLLCNTCRAI